MSARLPVPRRARWSALVAAFVAVLAAVPAAGQETTGAREPVAVMSFIDSGINPYHVTFRDQDNPRAHQHPSTYIEGYPKDAVALPVSLDEPDWRTAVLEDCELWQSVEPRTLYWFPGTKIVGAISFVPKRPFDCSLVGNRQQLQSTRILDDDDFFGHGTMVASRGASVEYGGCKECLIVAVHQDEVLGDPESAMAPVRWAADAGWIDVQSNSWASMAPVWEPSGATSPFAASPEMVRAAEYAARKQPSFWATMNGAFYQGGLVGHPSLLSPHFGPSVIAVGGHDSGYVTSWSGSNAHVVHDVCGSWAAHHLSTTHSSVEEGSGTSSATPYVAGSASTLILEARRILGDLRTGVRDGVLAQGASGLVPVGPLADGNFTVAELRDVLFKTATPRPEGEPEDGVRCDTMEDATTHPQWFTSPVKWSDVPSQFPAYTAIGYGAVDRAAMGLATRVLHGQAPLPERTDEDRWFALDRQIRSAKYEALRAGE